MPEKPQVEHVVRTADVIPLNMRLIELEAEQCRWPSGNGTLASPYLFCGNPTIDNCSYCWSHFRISLREAA